MTELVLNKDDKNFNGNNDENDITTQIPDKDSIPANDENLGPVEMLGNDRKSWCCYEKHRTFVH